MSTGKEKYLHLRQSFKTQEENLVAQKAKAQQYSEEFKRDLELAKSKYLKRQPPQAVATIKKEQEELELKKAKLPTSRRRSTKNEKKEV